ncbi:MAG: hypothetical protein QOH70_2360 [Blastocatellia bacterium]|nr:hypothetical protein [Blastocatellia bacterium]
MEKAGPSHKSGHFLTAFGAVSLGGDLQPLTCVLTPQGTPGLPGILITTIRLSMGARLNVRVPFDDLPTSVGSFIQETVVIVALLIIHKALVMN